MGSPYHITDPSRMHRGIPRAGTPTKSLRERLLLLSAKARLKRMRESIWQAQYRLACADMVHASAAGKTSVTIDVILSEPVKTRLAYTDAIEVSEDLDSGKTTLCWQ